MGLTLQLPSVHAVCSGDPPPIHTPLLQLQIHHPLRPIHRFQLPIHPCLVAIPVSLTTNTHPPLLHNCCLSAQCSCPRKIEKISVYSSAPELTRILPACPSSPSPAPCPVLAPSPHHRPTKSPPPLPHLHLLPPHSTLFQTSGFKPLLSRSSPLCVVWCGGAGPPHTRVTTGGQAGGRPARGAVIVRVDSCQSPPSTSVYQLASPMTPLCPHTHPHQVGWLPRDTKTTNVKNHLRITKTRLDTLR